VSWSESAMRQCRACCRLACCPPDPRLGTPPAPHAMAADNNGLQIAHRFAFGEAGSELPPGAGEWLRAGLRRFLRGDSPSLEVALSLTGGSRIAARNRALRDAAAALDPEPRLSAWELSGRLECAIRRFESVALVQINRGQPVVLSTPDEFLLAAFQSGARPMRSRRRLYELLSC